MKKCNGKNRYSKREADRMKGIIGRGRGKSLRIYLCPKCYDYHLTKRGYD